MCAALLQRYTALLYTEYAALNYTALLNSVHTALCVLHCICCIVYTALHVLHCVCCTVRLVGCLLGCVPSSDPSESVCLPLRSRGIYLEGESVISLRLESLLLVLYGVRKREGGREGKGMREREEEGRRERGRKGGIRGRDRNAE